MSETEYVYVRGQGWVPYTQVTWITKDASGRDVRLEVRTPSDGEYYISLWVWEGSSALRGRVVIQEEINDSLKIYCITDYTQFRGQPSEEYVYIAMTYV